MRIRRQLMLSLAFAGILTATAGVSAEPAGLLSIENKYIKVFLNNTAEETGRFAVDVTGGDPERADDDNKPLIYGRPKPWTSFTTIQINGVNYVFGKATTKRAGAGLPGGEIVEPPRLAETGLTMKCRYGSVTVEQVVNITRSPSTGALDTARIRYLVTNEGTEPLQLGLRELLDTMVGDNDGAPFRVGNQEITTDRRFTKEQCPDFWQAFDSLTKPAVIAQGTLRGGDVTTPDQVVFTNWGRAADHPWEIPLSEGADFTRDGEDELDSALVMTWFPREVKPGERFEVVADYGLGGVTFSPGNTYLGITAPSEVRYSLDNPRTYLVIMYLEHRGEVKAQNVKIQLNLPAGLVTAAGVTEITIPELIPGVLKQFAWEIKPDGQFSGETGFTIDVTGEQLETNQVTRKVRIIGPPKLAGKLIIPSLEIKAEQWQPNPLPVQVELKNSGETPASGVKAVLVNDDGFRLAPGERAEKYLGNLDANESLTVGWQLIPTGNATSGQLKAEITGNGLQPQWLTAEAVIPVLPVQLRLAGPEKLVPGQVYMVDVVAYNLKDVSKFKLNLNYNPQQLRLINVSRGTFLVEGDGLASWSPGTVDYQAGTVTGVNGVRDQPFAGSETTLARFNFIVSSQAAGPGQVGASECSLYNGSGQPVPAKLSSVQYQVGEEAQ